MEIKQNISRQIKTQRTHISDSSLRTYSSCIYSIFKALRGEGDPREFFSKHVDDALKHGETLKPASWKTTAAALFVLTGKKEYQTEMLAAQRIVNNNYAKHTTAPERKVNLPQQSELQELFNASQQQLKRNPSKENFVRFLMIAVTCGVLFPPRRNMDWILLKWKNFTSADNYVHRKVFVFNKYKTSRTNGPQTIPVPSQLNAILNKWKKVNESDYIFVNKSGKPFSTSHWTKELNRIYGQHISTDALRSIHVTQNQNVHDALETLETTAKQMGTSPEMLANVYLKQD